MKPLKYIGFCNLNFYYFRAKEESRRVQEMEEKAIQSQIESQERQAAAEKEVLSNIISVLIS